MDTLDNIVRRSPAMMQVVYTENVYPLLTASVSLDMPTYLAIKLYVTVIGERAVPTEVYVISLGNATVPQQLVGLVRGVRTPSVTPLLDYVYTEVSVWEQVLATVTPLDYQVPIPQVGPVDYAK